MENALLILGLVFPGLAWLTLVAGAIQSRVTGKSYSSVCIPFIGPILIDIWLLVIGAPAWSLILPWIGDIGTLLFLWVLPGLVADEWRHSRFTRTVLFVGVLGNQTVEISLHKGGRYVLKKQWSRRSNECGLTAFGEPGTFEREGDEFTLTSHSGWTRIIRRQGDAFLVADKEAEGDYNLDGWTLQNRNA
jgi:hypothetical protein